MAQPGRRLPHPTELEEEGSIRYSSFGWGAEKWLVVELAAAIGPLQTDPDTAASVNLL